MAAMSRAGSLVRDTFDTRCLNAGLRLLNELIGGSETLRPYLPLRLVSSGGYPSMVVLESRTHINGIDYFFNPRVDAGINDVTKQKEIEDELTQLIHETAAELDLNRNWCTAEKMAPFVALLQDPLTLYTRSVEQHDVLFRGKHLVVYAAAWEWVLARTLKRMQLPDRAQRREDIGDCVIMLFAMERVSGRQLPRQALREFDNLDRELPVSDATIVQINELYNKMYGKDAVV